MDLYQQLLNMQESSIKRTLIGILNQEVVEFDFNDMLLGEELFNLFDIAKEYDPYDIEKLLVESRVKDHIKFPALVQLTSLANRYNDCGGFIDQGIEIGLRGSWLKEYDDKISPFFQAQNALNELLETIWTSCAIDEVLEMFDLDDKKNINDVISVTRKDIHIKGLVGEIYTYGLLKRFCEAYSDFSIVTGLHGENIVLPFETDNNYILRTDRTNFSFKIYETVDYEDETLEINRVEGDILLLYKNMVPIIVEVKYVDHRAKNQKQSPKFSTKFDTYYNTFRKIPLFLMASTSNGTVSSYVHNSRTPDLSYHHLRYNDTSFNLLQEIKQSITQKRKYFLNA